MFKRIKNLLDISRYTVDEVVNKKTVFYTVPENNIELKNFGETTSDLPLRPAQIISLKSDDSFYDTLEQPSDDTTSRN